MSLMSKWFATPESQYTYDDPFQRLVSRLMKADGTGLSSTLSSTMHDFRMDTSETDNSFLISADLPGVNKSDIKVKVREDNTISIEADRKEEHTGEDSCSNWSEKIYGHVQRSLKLPKSADHKNVECKYENGVLTVRIGKRDTSPQSTDSGYVPIN